jgi:hypothetical protein
MPVEYRVPGLPDTVLAAGQTTYLATVGHNAAFARFLRRDEMKRDPLPLQGFHSAQDFLDGTQFTTAVVEASEDLGVSWTRPEDFPIDDYWSLDVLHGLRDDGFLALMADGKRQLVGRKALPEFTRALLTRNGRESIRTAEVFVQEPAIQDRLNSH